MKHRKPPAVAVWILDRLGVTAHNEALIGDLLEEFRSGRSVGWYWRQTFVALIACLARRFNGHRPELTALMIGAGTQLAVLFSLWWLRIPLGLTGILWGTAALLAVALVLCLEVRLKFRSWWEQDGMTEEKFLARVSRAAVVRFMAVYIFAVNMMILSCIVGELCVFELAPAARHEK